MPNDPTDKPRVIQVAEGVWVRQAVDVMGWVDLGEKVLVVDALEQPDLAEEILDTIDDSAGKPIGWVLNTHTHHDHTALNEVFHERHGAEIINHHTHTIPVDGMWIEGLKRRVQFIPAGGCHSAGDCLAWTPEARVLFVGDLFGWGLVPPNGPLAPGQADVIRGTYRRMIDFDAQVVAPGHGPVCATRELRRWLEYFDWLELQIAPRVRSGESDAEILEQVPPPADMRHWWRFLDWKHANSVEKVADACRAGVMGC